MDHPQPGEVDGLLTRWLQIDRRDRLTNVAGGVLAFGPLIVLILTGQIHQGAWGTLGWYGLSMMPLVVVSLIDSVRTNRAKREIEARLGVIDDPRTARAIAVILARTDPRVLRVRHMLPKLEAELASPRIKEVTPDPLFESSMRALLDRWWWGHFGTRDHTERTMAVATWLQRFGTTETSRRMLERIANSKVGGAHAEAVREAIRPLR